MAEISVAKLEKYGDRTMLLEKDDEGKITPGTVSLKTREASSAPEGTRIKCVLVLDPPDGEEAEHVQAMPFGQVQMGPLMGFNHEFRLEMN